MNMMKLALAGLKFRGFSSALNVISLALGIALVLALTHLGSAARRNLEGDLAGIDLVVSGKGSPLQMILASVFQLDVPTGNIPGDAAEELARDRRIAFILPEAMGDNYGGYRILGTVPAYAEHFGAGLAEGGFWTEPMQAVLGAEVARRSGLKIGDSFAGAHGLAAGGEEHEDFPYTVVGILKPTGRVADRLVLTDVASVWKVHEFADEDHPEEMLLADAEGRMPRELTALLIGLRAPVARQDILRRINESSSMQAAAPAQEMARLYALMGPGADTARLFAGVLALLAGLGFFATLLGAVNERRYDLALMRSLGASRARLAGLMLAEGLILAFAAALLGLLLALGAEAAARAWLEEARHVVLPLAGMTASDALLLLGALGVGAAASLLPALLAFRLDAAGVLARGGGA
jgi:putative ABC transport system permease protein